MKATRRLVAIIIILSLASQLSWSQPKEQDVLNRAQQFYDAEDYSSCIKQLQVLPLADRKASAEVYGLLGACQYELGQYEESVSSLGISLAKDPKAIHNYIRRGHVLIQLTRYAEAVKDFEKVLKQRRKIDNDQLNIAILSYTYALIQNNETDKAIRFLEQHHHNDVDMLNDLAYYTVAYKKDADKAIVYWEKVLSIDPAYASALENLSITYFELGDYNMAFYHIENLLRHYPDYGRGHYLRGVYLQESGEDGDALLCFQRAEELGYEVEDN